MKCLACPTEVPEGDRYCSETCAGIADLTLRSVSEVAPQSFYRPAPPPSTGETLWEMVTRVSRESAVHTLTESLVSAILATDGLDRSEYITRTARALQEQMQHV